MNEQLRQHVTNQSFVLTMRKTHILAMVAADYAFRNPGQRLLHFPHWVSAMRGCRERGLAVHHPPPGIRKGDLPLSEYYSFTRAGELVCELLNEAGLWQEAEKELGITESEAA